jgi:hypothetical protein
MPPHDRDTVRQQLEDCVFAGRNLTRPVPKYRFPPHEAQPAEAFQVVSDELMLDDNARVSQDMASLLLDDFRDAVAHFSRHPVTVPMSKEESGGFSHL